MDEAVSAAEANRGFSRILRQVRAGRSFTVTSHGRPVARIVPPDTDSAAARSAHEALMARLDKEPAEPATSWRREDLYARDR